jgi:Ca2+-binding EF-hand superfamily protein
MDRKFKFAKLFDIKKLIEECDADGNDFIDHNELLNAAMDWQITLSRKRLESTFKTLN